MWSVSDENASVRGRSGPDKGLPAIGASALAGREGRLRACMRDVQWFLLAFISSQVLNCQLLNRGGAFGVPVQWLTTTHKTPVCGVMVHAVGHRPAREGANKFLI